MTRDARPDAGDGQAKGDGCDPGRRAAEADRGECHDVKNRGQRKARTDNERPVLERRTEFRCPSQVQDDAEGEKDSGDLH